MLDAFIIDRIRRDQDKIDRRDQPHVNDLDDGRPPVDIKHPKNNLKEAFWI